MSVSIKSAHEIELMRESCRRLSIVHKELEEAIRPGISTLDIDRLGEKLIPFKRNMEVLCRLRIMQKLRF